MSNGPTFGNGKICYMEIPADDPSTASLFYQHVFGWNIRKRGDGSISFDDGVGQVSGTWVQGREVATQVSVLIHIMVDDIEDTMQKVIANGGKIVQPVGADHPEITARFTDPYGNTFGLYQHRGE